MDILNSYVPESFLLRGKDGDKCRFFHDDCAILNADNSFRVIASRGLEKHIGAPFFDVIEADADTQARVQEFLRSENPYMLLPYGEKSVLLVSAWYKHTHLVPAFVLHAPEREVRQILNFASRDAFSQVFRMANEPQAGEESLREQLLEIFYYLDGLTAPGRNFWTHCRMVAAFLGCQMERIELPYLPNGMSTPLFHRVTAFLSCALLILRHRTGEVQASGHFTTRASDENVGKVQIEKAADEPLTAIPVSSFLPADFVLHIEQISHFSAQRDANRTDTSLPDPLSVLTEIPAFRDLCIRCEDGKLTLEARLDSSDQLCANTSELPWIRLSFFAAG